MGPENGFLGAAPCLRSNKDHRYGPENRSRNARINLQVLFLWPSSCINCITLASSTLHLPSNSIPQMKLCAGSPVSLGFTIYKSPLFTASPRSAGKWHNWNCFINSITDFKYKTPLAGFTNLFSMIYQWHDI